MTRVVAAQLSLSVGDVPGNRRSARDAIATAAADGAELVVLPELSDTGYVFSDRDEALSLADPGPTVDGWVAAAREFGVIVVGGYCDRSGDSLTNSAVVVDGTGVLAHYDKVHLWGRESEVFTPGTAPPPVVDTTVGRIGLLVCYDLEFPEWVRLAADAGADVVAAPVNWPLADRPSGERPIEVVKAQAAAAYYGVHLVVADRCGNDRGTRWVGGACIVDRTGYLVAGPSLEDAPALVAADLDLAAARDKRLGSHNHLVGDRRPDLYR
ncbi:MAG TPA: nitrilase-related carbon-nitrogen hydrolase [Acidimicrobiales bacterium]